MSVKDAAIRQLDATMRELRKGIEQIPAGHWATAEIDYLVPARHVLHALEATAGYLRTLNFFGATAKLGVVVPFAWGDYTGLWLEQPAKASRRGFADPLLSFAVNFVGAPARTLGELGTYREGTVVGAALMAVVPGDDTKPTIWEDYRKIVAASGENVVEREGLADGVAARREMDDTE